MTQTYRPLFKLARSTLSRALILIPALYAWSSAAFVHLTYEARIENDDGTYTYTAVKAEDEFGLYLIHHEKSAPNQVCSILRGHLSNDLTTIFHDETQIRSQYPAGIQYVILKPDQNYEKFSVSKETRDFYTKFIKTIRCSKNLSSQISNNSVHYQNRILKGLREVEFSYPRFNFDPKTLADLPISAQSNLGGVCKLLTNSTKVLKWEPYPLYDAGITPNPCRFCFRKRRALKSAISLRAALISPYGFLSHVIEEKTPVGIKSITCERGKRPFPSLEFEPSELLSTYEKMSSFLKPVYERLIKNTLAVFSDLKIHAGSKSFSHTHKLYLSFLSGLLQLDDSSLTNGSKWYSELAMPKIRAYYDPEFLQAHTPDCLDIRFTAGFLSYGLGSLSASFNLETLELFNKTKSVALDILDQESCQLGQLFAKSQELLVLYTNLKSTALDRISGQSDGERHAVLALNKSYVYLKKSTGGGP